jgi:Mn-dependent DtxR family transcriptional regulator
VLGTLLEHGPLGVTEVGNLTGMPVSSVHASFGKLANAGLVEVDNKKRQLTEAGREAALRDS